MLPTGPEGRLTFPATGSSYVSMNNQPSVQGTSRLFFLCRPAHTAPGPASLEQTYLLWPPPRASPRSQSLGAPVPPTGAQRGDHCPVGPSIPQTEVGQSPVVWGLLLGAGYLPPSSTPARPHPGERCPSPGLHVLPSPCSAPERSPLPRPPDTDPTPAPPTLASSGSPAVSSTSRWVEGQSWRRSPGLPSPQALAPPCTAEGLGSVPGGWAVCGHPHIGHQQFWTRGEGVW